MTSKINHRDLELNIGKVCHCDDYLQLKVSAYYPFYNGIVIASRRGEDKFFLGARGPKSDLSDAIPLDGRYLVIGEVNRSQNAIFRQCVLQTKTDTWLTVPDDLFMTRLLIAGAIRVVVSTDDLSKAIAATPEFQQAKADGRVIFTCE